MRLSNVCAAALLVYMSAAAAPEDQPKSPLLTLSDKLQGLQFRNIGPFRGGRVTAVAGAPGQPLAFYFGGTGGGVWKTTDGGANWEPVSDKFFKTGSVGALAVAPSDPNVVYAGMGEGCIRGNVSGGDGVWKSTDAGKTWVNVGLPDTQQIPRVRVHPQNPDVVYVAALGHPWAPNPDRGIFRSTDGGKTWKKVLYVDEKTGASDLVMDATNPRILWAGFWQVGRKPWSLESGGPGGGVWKTTDGGDTWKKLAGGLPEGIVGRVGLAVSPARPERAWAIVEAEKGGVFRTDDGGETWKKVNDENKLRQRAWYYSHVYADPKNADAVYVLNVAFFRSGDGGKSFDPIRTPHGDNHDLWIDPSDPQRMIEGNDGGAAVTFNGGRSWSSILNQPTAQFYRVVTDSRFPYRVYGAQQDNTTVEILSRTRRGGIGPGDWHPVGGCESGWIAPKPDDPDVSFAGCYGGAIERYDDRTGEGRDVVAWPQLAVGQASKDLKYRFQWNAPILISPHDPRTLYHAAQVLLKSTDDGATWTEISPDLTRNEKATQDYSGGPITRDNTGVEVYGVIFALAESSHEAGTIWAGSDDGLVHLTRDGGKNWTNVTPRGLPERIQINSIELSPHERATAWIAATMYKHDDARPYLYRTSDYGKTWTKLVNGIPDGAFTRVVREDPSRRGLVFAGTERGLFVSLDDGASWQPFQRNLPAVPITDLTVKDGDLVVATQGRAFWILDDLSSLRQWTPAVEKEAIRLFKPRPAVRFGSGGRGEGGPPRGVGQNPPVGAILDVWLKEAPPEKPAPKDALTLEILDGDKVLRTFTSEKKKEAEDGAAPDEDAEKPLELKQGLNRLTWDLRMLKPSLVPKAIVWGPKEGPLVAPGTYGVRVKRGETVLTDVVEVRANPMVKAPPDDLKKQSAFLADVRDRISETHEAALTCRDVKKQVKEVSERAARLGKKEPLASKGKALSEKLSAIEEKLVNPKTKSEQDILNFPPQLDHQFVGVASVAGSGEGAPLASSIAYFTELKGRLADLKRQLQAVLDTDLVDFNKAVQEQGIPAVAPAPREGKR
jgi:photosystem II stability/assembly factor-like uncharacterized protein